jgi:orotidine-5'-phosphate decarboxylase
VKAAHKEDLISIIDDKLNDIDDTNAAICEAYYNLGFDGIIVNPFVGWKGGLDQVFQLSHNRGKGVITLVYMSHPGAVEGYGRLVIVNGEEPRPFYHIFAENAKTWGSDGVVVGATRPEIVTEVKTILGDDVQIFSPGIGVQGGRITPNTGSDFYIIGRSITGASNPETAAQDFARQSMNSN